MTALSIRSFYSSVCTGQGFSSRSLVLPLFRERGLKIRFYRQDSSDAASASQKTQARFSGKWMGTVGVSPILNISWNSSLLASMESAGLQRKIKRKPGCARFLFLVQKINPARPYRTFNNLLPQKQVGALRMGSRSLPPAQSREVCNPPSERGSR